jgi:TPR repeat protein
MEQSCDGGASNGCRFLGKLHQAGTGVSKDHKRAAKLFEKACAKGHQPACTDLADYYAAGTRWPTCCVSVERPKRATRTTPQRASSLPRATSAKRTAATSDVLMVPSARRWGPRCKFGPEHPQ